MPSSLPAAILSLVDRIRGAGSLRSVSRRARQMDRQRVATLQRALADNKLAALAEEMAGIGHWRRDLAAGTAVWSPQIYRIAGLEPGKGALELETSVALFHPDDRETVRQAVQTSIEKAVDFAIQARMVRPDGEIRHVVCRGAPEVAEDGRVTGTFGVIMDVTAAHRAQEILRESENRYRLIAENATDIIVQTDVSGRLVYVSPSIEAATGFAPEIVLGRQSLSLIAPEDRPAVAAVLEATLQGREPWRVECRVPRRDGGALWLEARPTPVRDPVTGEVVAVNDSLRDISERKAVEAQLRHARREAEDAAKAKADFLANMSHELRTPLTSIVGFSTLLRDQSGMDPATARYVDRIAAASQALLTLVNDILDFSKLEAGQVALKLRAVSPRGLLEDALGMLLPQADAKDLDLRLELDPELPERLCLDPDRLRQVLLNLIGNAVKFTERGGVVVRARYDRAGGRLRCEVQDTGPGVSREQLERLFVRFSQVDGSTTRSHGGTGLGLAISKALVEAMRGEIGAESVAGQGSTFWFEAPLVEAAAGPMAAPVEAGEVESVEAARILIVDDHQTNRDLARAILTPLGCELSEAEDGAAAVSAAESQIFDLILMDVRMPGMDGPAAVRAIRAGEGPNSNIPILAFTADAAEEDRDSLIAAGFDDRVLKPVTPQALVASVSSWLADPEPYQDQGQTHDAA